MNWAKVTTTNIGKTQHEGNSLTEARVSKVEEKLEAINNRVAKLEGALTAIQHSSFGASNNRY